MKRLLSRDEEVEYPNINFIKHLFVETTTIPTTIKSHQLISNAAAQVPTFMLIKTYSFHQLKLLKDAWSKEKPCNYIGHQKKDKTFSLQLTSLPVIRKIFEKLTGWQFQVSDLSPHFLKTGAAIDTFQKSEETREAYGRDQRICVISPAHHSLKPPWNTIWNEEYL